MSWYDASTLKVVAYFTVKGQKSVGYFKRTVFLTGLKNHLQVTMN